MTTMTNAPSPRAAWQDADVLWQHRALCAVALPSRAPRAGLWSRESDGVVVAVGSADATAPEGTLPLPAGAGLRLLLLHAFTAALRGGEVAAEIGPDAASAAASLGLEPTPQRVREFEEQAARLLAAKLRVTEAAGGAPMSVLDARGRRSARSEWRPTVRLNARFFDSLARNAVALDRRVVAALAGSAMALDAYAWLVASTPTADEARPVLVTWESLRDRFGQGASPRARFEAAFTESLAAVQELYPAARFTVGPDGVELLGAARPSGAAATGPVTAAEAPDGPPVVGAADEGEAPPVNLAGPDTPPDPVPPLAAADPEPAPEPPHDTGKPPAVVPDALAQHPAETAPAVRLDRPAPERNPSGMRERDGGRIRLMPRHTGLSQTMWLRRGHGQPGVTVEVTPGADYHPARRSVLVVEPMVMQVAGQLPQHELGQVAAWIMANADLIQDYWDGRTASEADVHERVRCAPSSRW